MIQVFQPTLGAEEQAAAAAVLASGWVGMGPKVKAFEQVWADFVPLPRENVYAVACATDGLFQIFDYIASTRNRNSLSANFNRRDVLMPANSFIGLANAVDDSALNPALCDIDRRTLNPTARTIERALTRQTCAVCVQHYGGVMSEMDDIAALCRAAGVLLIEDCACAPGGSYLGHSAGHYGDFAVWSFDGMKIMTAGDGGMVYCQDAAVAAELRRGARLGQSVLSGQESDAERWWEFTAEGVGRRSLMNDLGAAVGLEQLKKLPGLIAQRAHLWEQYQDHLSDLAWLGTPPELEPGVCSSYYTYWVQTHYRDELARWLRQRDIYTTYRYWPVNRAYGWPATTPASEWAADHTLNLPLHANLTDADIHRICDAIQEFGEKQL